MGVAVGEGRKGKLRGEKGGKEEGVAASAEEIWEIKPEKSGRAAVEGKKPRRKKSQRIKTNRQEIRGGGAVKKKKIGARYRKSVANTNRAAISH